MAWYFGMIAGAAATALAIIVFLYVMSAINHRRWVRNRKVRERQSSAEHEMQRVVQKTINEMFIATRGNR